MAQPPLEDHERDAHRDEQASELAPRQVKPEGVRGGGLGGGEHEQADGEALEPVKMRYAAGGGVVHLAVKLEHERAIRCRLRPRRCGRWRGRQLVEKCEIAVAGLQSHEIFMPDL